jgi:cytochrome c oxidase cbb3-type subunit 3
MTQTIWIFSIVVLAAGVAAAQRPDGTAPSPASLPRPQTVVAQSYPAEQVQAGEQAFVSQCGFCHGRDAAGGETGPDLTRSKLVAEDIRGNKIGPLVDAGRVDQGMPSFSLKDTDMTAIVAFIHDQKTKSEALGGGRRSVEPADLATGNAVAGRSYFNGAGKCSSCHSPTGDLAGVASRYEGLALLQRMLYPSGRPAPARPNATVSLPSGETVVGPLASQDEFTIVVLDPSGARQTYQKGAVKFKIDEPLAAHFEQLGKYTDDEMHNVYAWLVTLK